jgi:hypothetical protein
MAAYALTIFIGAFLLFQVQPLMAKYILPWFGGGPGVWTTCMLFFQVLLLGGYAYAHLTSRWLKPRLQALVHLLLLVAAVGWLCFLVPGDNWKPQGGGNPTLQILLLLTASLGLPYFVLSSTGPLVQQWFSRANPNRSPYRLYALSNVGSLLALVSYPFFFEPRFTRKTQALFWGIGLVGYVVCCGFCAIRLWRSESRDVKPETLEPATSKPPSSFENQFPQAGSQQPSLVAQLLWLLLPACASALLLATTNKMCQDVAVIPFLWVLPLALYLLSFIICFDSPRWYVRFPFTLALIAASAAICWALFVGTELAIRKQVAIYSVGLFVCCMVCHGELYRLRPDPKYLTGFYLMISAGGALGGMFVAVAAPLVFKDYYELHWSLIMCGVLFLVVCALKPGASMDAESEARREFWIARVFSSANEWRLLACALPLVVFLGLDRFLAWLTPDMKILAKEKFPGVTDSLRHVAEALDGLLAKFGTHHGMVDSSLVARIAMWSLLVVLAGGWVISGRFKAFRYWRLLTCLWLSLTLVALGVVLRAQALKTDGEIVSRSRNFYGVLTVIEHEKDKPKNHYFLLQHGRITHGIQFVDPERAKWPTSYYGEDSGIAMAFEVLPAGPRRIGVIGLGTGSITVYGRPGDSLRIYEINSQVETLANSRFTYLQNCRDLKADVKVVLGDARLSLEREPSQNFDLIVLDAFSSDAIPVHLLTKESFEVYQKHLNPNGIIVVHISNRYLDLEPVVINLARKFDLKIATVDYDEDDVQWWLYGSTWVLLSRNQAVLESPGIRDANADHAASSKAFQKAAKVPVWTDDFTSLFQILK